jgi:hypothetical protein
VWEVTVPATEVAALRAFGPVSATVRRGDEVAVRVLAAEAPHVAARRAEPTLEEVYLHHLALARETVPA